MIHFHLLYGIRGGGMSWYNQICNLKEPFTIKTCREDNFKNKSRASCDYIFSRCLFTVDTNEMCWVKMSTSMDGTRGGDNLRMHTHRTALYEQLPSQVGLKTINHLLRELENPKHFKSQLKQQLLTYTIYSVRKIWPLR